jgi:hypothetical protein
MADTHGSAIVRTGGREVIERVSLDVRSSPESSCSSPCSSETQCPLRVSEALSRFHLTTSARYARRHSRITRCLHSR